MAEVLEKGEFGRLEDFILLAKKGKDVHVEIELRKQLGKQKVHPEETEEMKDEIDTYLLIGDYTFSVEGETRSVSKVYMFGTLEESLDASKIDENITNGRLKMDYQRLKDANIPIEEKYF
jgi:SOS response regulatory protein OraA/RecX